MTARNGLYRGYSSFEFESTGSFKINDVELIKLDLLNHIFTRRGERVMMPRFGTVIPDLVFEPLDSTTTEILEDELRSVFEFDPRVEIVKFQLIVDEGTHSVTLDAQLFYVELDIVDNFELNIVFEG